ncbi:MULTISPECIES: hypothetical protein [unclassified Rhizobium]|nr:MULTISPECIES: hypothetical protein [unclassified Rhizobium]
MGGFVNAEERGCALGGAGWLGAAHIVAMTENHVALPAIML